MECFNLVVALGLEPRMSEPKSEVLPLHHATIYRSPYGNRTRVFTVKG